MKCKFKKREHQISYDGGQTWTTDQIIKGDLIEAQSPDCPDDAYIDRWIVIDGAYLCDGKNKYKKEAYQVSYDDGLTWYYSTPMVYRLGDFVAYDENFCNNLFVGHYNAVQSGIASTFDPLKVVKSIGQTSLTSADTSYYGNIYQDNTHWYRMVLTSCTIGDDVTSIANNTFRGCSSLSSVTIPNSVTSIGNNAFYYCRSLTSVDIPSGVTSISDGTFYQCSSLSSVTIPDSVTSIGRQAFEMCTRLLNVIIPSGVTSISDYVFFDCTSLSNITLPSGLTTIGSSAFRNCSGLTSVDIPSGVTSIGDYAFYYCRRLSSIIVNATTPPTLGEHSLEETNYCTIFVPCESLDEYKNENVWHNYIDRLEGIPPCDTGIRYRWQPSGYTCDGYDKYQNNIRQISYDSGTTWENVSPPQYSASTLIEANSEYCGYTPPLPSGTKWLATYSDSHTSSGACNSNARISSGEVASANCVNIRIGECVTSIDNRAFQGYTSLSSITIPNSVSGISGNAFSGCTNLSSVIIPDSVTYLGGQAFASCTSLTSVTIGSGVTTINSYEFARCSNLTSIIIPSGITSIEAYAFSGCRSLYSVTCLRTTPPSLGVYAFDLTSANLVIYVPAESVTEYRNHGGWSNLASRIQPIPTP